MSDDPEDPRPPLPETADEWDRAAAWYERRWQYHRGMAERMRSDADAARRRAGKIRGGTGPLQNMSHEGTLGTNPMESNSPSAGANISAAKTKTRLPFTLALHKRNLSLPEWARAQRKPGIEEETARAWCKAPGKGGRKIPREWAERIEKEFVDENGKTEVPANKRSWPNDIR